MTTRWCIRHWHIFVSISILIPFYAQIFFINENVNLSAIESHWILVSFFMVTRKFTSSSAWITIEKFLDADRLLSNYHFDEKKKSFHIYIHTHGSRGGKTSIHAQVTPKRNFSLVFNFCKFTAYLLSSLNLSVLAPSARTRRALCTLLPFSKLCRRFI